MVLIAPNCGAFGLSSRTTDRSGRLGFFRFGFIVFFFFFRGDLWGEISSVLCGFVCFLVLGVWGDFSMVFSLYVFCLVLGVMFHIYTFFWCGSHTVGFFFFFLGGGVAVVLGCFRVVLKKKKNVFYVGLIQ